MISQDGSKNHRKYQIGEHLPENQGPRRGRRMELGVSYESFVAWVCAMCCILGVCEPLVYIQTCCRGVHVSPRDPGL